MEKAKQTFQGIYGMMWDKPALRFTELDQSKTALVVIDMVNGFVREGAMKNELAEEIIEPITSYMKKFNEKNMPVIAFGDCHKKDSPEFRSYPVHCLEGSSQAELIDEIKEVGGYKYIAKSSTNGVLEEEFQEWLKENPQITDFVVTGVCTDICVMQFCLTLKAYLDKNNVKSRIILPLNAIETYEKGGHQITLTNTMGIYFMEQNGAEVYFEINLKGYNPIKIIDGGK